MTQGPSPRPTSAWFSPEKGVAGLIVAGVLLRLATASWVGLGYGESYHFSGAIRPSLSYFDHPPLTFWLAGLSLKLFGQVGPLVLRAPFIAMFAGTTWLTFVVGRRLFGPWPGFYAALLLNLSAVFTLSTAIFVQPDGPLMFFWMACLWCLTRIVFPPRPARPWLWWAALGLSLGLAMLGKYHALFIPLGAGVFLLTRSDQRRLLASPGPYLALALALAVSSPVIIWNIEHNWISFLWQGGRGVDSAGFRPDWLLRNVVGQALLVLPWLWLPLLWELFKSLAAGPRNKERWFIACLAVWPIGLFTLVSAYASIGYHFHWQAPGYILLFLPLGQSLDQALRRGRRWAAWWLKGSVVLTCLTLVLVVSHAATGWARGIILSVAPPQAAATADPALEMLDWQPLEEALAQRGLLNKKKLFIFTNRWFLSGKVDYALKGKMPVLCLNAQDPRSWAFYTNPDHWLGKDGVMVATEPFKGDFVAEFGDYFLRISYLGPVDIKRGGRVDKVLQLYYCHKQLHPFPRPY